MSMRGILYTALVAFGVLVVVELLANFGADFRRILPKRPVASPSTAQTGQQIEGSTGQG